MAAAFPVFFYSCFCLINCLFLIIKYVTIVSHLPGQRAVYLKSVLEDANSKCLHDMFEEQYYNICENLNHEDM